MKIRIPARISPRQAVAMQVKLSSLVKEASELPSTIENLVGCDATYFEGTTLAAASLVDYESQHLEGIRLIREKTRFPYIPGLLAFREAPAVLRAIRSLRAKSFVCLVDAHGRAHPRKFGLACFVGLSLDKPTIGVAKSKLYGNVNGNSVVDENGEQLAQILQLPSSSKTVYVSVGHKVSLPDAVSIVMRCLTSRGPVPITVAHDEVTNEKWRLKKSNPAS